MVDALCDDVVLHIFSFLPPRDLARASGACRDFRAKAHSDVLWWPLCAARWNLPPLRRALVPHEQRWARTFRAWEEQGHAPHGRFASTSEAPVIAAAAGVRAGVSGPPRSPAAAAADEPTDATGARGVRAWASVLGTSDVRLRHGALVHPAPFACLLGAQPRCCDAVTPLASVPSPPRARLAPVSPRRPAVRGARGGGSGGGGSGGGGGGSAERAGLPALAALRPDADCAGLASLSGQLHVLPPWRQAGTISSPSAGWRSSSHYLVVKLCVQNVSYSPCSWALGARCNREGAGLVSDAVVDALVTAADISAIMWNGDCLPALLPVLATAADTAQPGVHAGDNGAAPRRQPPPVEGDRGPGPAAGAATGQLQLPQHASFVLAANGAGWCDEQAPAADEGPGAAPLPAASAASVVLAPGASAVLRLCFPFPARAEDATSPFEPEVLEEVSHVLVPVRLRAHPHPVTHTLKLQFPRHRVWDGYQVVNEHNVARAPLELGDRAGARF